MLAVRLHGRDDLRVEESPFPEPGPGEVTIRVKAAAVCGTDLRALRSGLAGTGPDSPRILGHEVAGEVAAVGEGVRGFQPGQRVAVAPNIGCGLCPLCADGKVHLCPSLTAVGIHLDGGFAEYVRIPAAGVAHGNIVPLPGHLSYAQAALVEPLACCYNTFTALNPRPGEHVMIYGAGPIGVLHLLLAKMVSPAGVIVADPQEERREAVRRFGADALVDPRRPGFLQTVASLTGGRGVDVTIVACPSPQAQADALNGAAVFGRISFFGGLPPEHQEALLNSNTIHYKQLLVTGTSRCSTAHYLQALSLVSRGAIDPERLVTERFPLRAAGDAFRTALAARGLKTLIEV